MMRRSGYLAAALGALTLASVSVSTVVAQEPGQGVVNAVSFQPFPQGVPILVRPLNDTDENLAIKREFEAALAAAGYSVASKESNLVLSFESRENVGAGPAPQPQTTFRLRDREGRLSVHEQRSVPKLIETPREGTQIYHPNRFRIDATIDDKENGTRLWQGWALAETEDRTSASLAKAMVPAIVGGIGRTERQKPFALK